MCVCLLSSTFLQLFPLNHISALVETHNNLSSSKTSYFVHFAVVGVDQCAVSVQNLDVTASRRWRRKHEQKLC